MNLVWYNGSFLKLNDIPASEFERLWRFGDGGFETLLFTPNGVPLFGLHSRRAITHAQLLEINLHLPDEAELNSILHKLAKENLVSAYGRVRITWFRSGGGFYHTDEKKANMLIENIPFDFENVNRKPEAILYTEQPLTFGTLSPFKKPGSAVYTHALQSAKKARAEEAILINTADEIAETATGNLLIKNGNIFTAPPKEAGGVEGIFLQYLSERLPELGYTLIRRRLNRNDLLNADEILSVNALRGICCVSTFEGKTYTSESIRLNVLLSFK